MSEQSVPPVKRWIADRTGTDPHDWIEAHGPETGTDVEHWYLNERTEQGAYVVIEPQSGDLRGIEIHDNAEELVPQRPAGPR